MHVPQQEAFLTNLKPEELYVKHAVAAWKPSQHLLEDRGRGGGDTCVEMAGRRTFQVLHADY
jgi:hypothetical protein